MRRLYAVLRSFSSGRTYMSFLDIQLDLSTLLKITVQYAQWFLLQSVILEGGTWWWINCSWDASYMFLFFFNLCFDSWLPCLPHICLNFCWFRWTVMGKFMHDNPLVSHSEVNRRHYLAAVAVGLGLGVAGLCKALHSGLSIPWATPRNLFLGSGRVYYVGGLRNLGNNCFLNVILQVFFYVHIDTAIWCASSMLLIWYPAGLMLNKITFPCRHLPAVIVLFPF